MKISDLHFYMVNHNELVGDTSNTFTFRANPQTPNPFAVHREPTLTCRKRTKPSDSRLPRKRPRQDPQPDPAKPTSQPLFTTVTIRQFTRSKKHADGKVNDIGDRTIEINMCTAYDDLHRELQRVAIASVLEKDTAPLGFASKIAIESWRGNFKIDSDAKWQGHKSLLLQAGARLCIEFQMQRAVDRTAAIRKKHRFMEAATKMMKKLTL